MRHGIAQQLGDRIDELLGDGLVELRFLAERAQLDVDPGRTTVVSKFLYFFENIS